MRLEVSYLWQNVIVIAVIYVALVIPDYYLWIQYRMADMWEAM